MPADVASLISTLIADPGRAAEVPVEAIPALISQLAAIQSVLAARLLPPHANGSATRRDQSDHPSPDGADECYLSARQLAERIGYAEKTIRNLKSNGAFQEGEHYVKVRGHVVYYWPAMKAWVESGGAQPVAAVPLVRSRRRGR